MAEQSHIARVFLQATDTRWLFLYKKPVENQKTSQKALTTTEKSSIINT
nr:MAG TPA: hypothetical protein [Caudoviricetes sp.]